MEVRIQLSHKFIRNNIAYCAFINRFLKFFFIIFVCLKFFKDIFKVSHVLVAFFTERTNSIHSRYNIFCSAADFVNGTKGILEQRSDGINFLRNSFLLSCKVCTVRVNLICRKSRNVCFLRNLLCLLPDSGNFTRNQSKRINHFCSVTRNLSKGRRSRTAGTMSLCNFFDCI